MDITTIFDKYAKKALQAQYPTFRFEDDSYSSVLTIEQDFDYGCCGHDSYAIERTYICFDGYGTTKNGKMRVRRTTQFPVSYFNTDNVLQSIVDLQKELEELYG